VVFWGEAGKHDGARLGGYGVGIITHGTVNHDGAGERASRAW